MHLKIFGNISKSVLGWGNPRLTAIRRANHFRYAAIPYNCIFGWASLSTKPIPGNGLSRNGCRLQSTHSNNNRYLRKRLGGKCLAQAWCGGKDGRLCLYLCNGLTGGNGYLQ